MQWEKWELISSFSRRLTFSVCILFEMFCLYSGWELSTLYSWATATGAYKYLQDPKWFADRSCWLYEAAEVSVSSTFTTEFLSSFGLCFNFLNGVNFAFHVSLCSRERSFFFRPDILPSSWTSSSLKLFYFCTFVSA